MKTFRPLDEPLQEHLKYSESMSVLKKMREIDDEGK